MAAHLGGALQHGLGGALLGARVERGDVGQGALALAADREEAAARADLDAVDCRLGEPDGCAGRHGPVEG